MKISNNAEALKMFENIAIDHIHYTQKGDTKNANECVITMQNVAAFLNENNALSALSVFLEHKNIHVRFCAAAYYLSIDEDYAIKILEGIASSSGMTSLNAFGTLSLWRESKNNKH
jgi:hypothetical protein